MSSFSSHTQGHMHQSSAELCQLTRVITDAASIQLCLVWQTLWGHTEWMWMSSGQIVLSTHLHSAVSIWNFSPIFYPEIDYIGRTVV